MIISKTPLRLNFFQEKGISLGSSINKYVYIIAKERFDNNILLKHSNIEIRKKVEEIQNEIWKESLKRTGIIKGVELISLKDIQEGEGLGEDTSFLIGSLNSLHALREKHKSEKELIKEAIEIDSKLLKLKDKSDYLLITFGGFNFIQINEEGEKVEKIIIPKSIKNQLSRNLLLFETEVKKEELSQDNRKEISENFSFTARDALHSLDIRKFGEILDEKWRYHIHKMNEKRDPKVIWKYNLAKSSGAIGGKICGKKENFLLLYVEPEKQDKVRECIGLKEIHFDLEGMDCGKKINYIGD